MFIDVTTYFYCMIGCFPRSVRSYPVCLSMHPRISIRGDVHRSISRSVCAAFVVAFKTCLRLSHRKSKLLKRLHLCIFWSGFSYWGRIIGPWASYREAISSRFGCMAGSDFVVIRCVLASLYEALSVRWSVGPLVGWSVRNAFAFWPTRSNLCRVFGLVFKC